VNLNKFTTFGEQEFSNELSEYTQTPTTYEMETVNISDLPGGNILNVLLCSDLISLPSILMELPALPAIPPLPGFHLPEPSIICSPTTPDLTQL